MLHRSHKAEHHHYPHLHRAHKEHDKHHDHIKERAQESESGQENNIENAVVQQPKPIIPAGIPGIPRERRAVTSAELQAEQRKHVLGSSELEKTLSSLNELSTNTTRRLDETYYAVLEKLSSLQSTLASMQELATISRGLKDEFENESGEVVEELNKQVTALGNFDQQQAKIVELQSRISTGREKVKKLESRVEVVQEKVKKWETQEVVSMQNMKYRRNLLRKSLITLGICCILFAVYRYSWPGKMSVATHPKDAIRKVANGAVSVAGKAQTAIEELEHDIGNLPREPHIMAAFDEL